MNLQKLLHVNDLLKIVINVYREENIYWTDNTGIIMKSKLDGSMVSTVLQQGVSEPGEPYLIHACLACLAVSH